MVLTRLCLEQKELKKLAKAQSQQPSTPASAPTPGSLPQPANGKPRPPVINTASAAPTRVGTPRTATPRTATPVVTPMQRTGTPLALPASANTPQQPPPLSQAQPPGQGPGKKGKKRDREREESGASGNSNASLVASAGQAEGQPRPVIANAKAGTAGIRPRPLKKQRMVCRFFNVNVFRLSIAGFLSLPFLSLARLFQSDVLVLMSILVGFAGTGARYFAGATAANSSRRMMGGHRAPLLETQNIIRSTWNVIAQRLCKSL